ncbi:insulinase family protein [Candidatus Woesearchaeota archaeon]|nr:insulinase family protein [Candidatus Woesearchaeota archaeon]
MRKFTLNNGLTIIYEPKKGRSVVIEVMIKTGSNQEAPAERGISHFLEHLLFEGTKNRPSNQEVSQEIEKIGGDINAYTSNERTCFYARVLNKHFEKAVEILADILQNPLFREDDVNREKKIILKEIDMVIDEPRFYQWILLQKNLFKKHPCQHPTYGERKDILQLNSKKIAAFYNKYYLPNNMVVSVVGDVKNCQGIISKYFTLQRKKMESTVPVKEPLEHKNTFTKEKKNISSTYFCLGFKTVPKNNKDAYPLEMINTLLGRGQSGRLFTEIRSKKGLAYDVGSQHVAEVSYGYFAAYACVDRKKVQLARESILAEIEKLKNISEKELQETAEAIEGEFLIDLDDSQKKADQLLFWEQAKDAHDLNHFVSNIKKITIADIRRVIEKYFKNYTFVVLEGK